MLKKVAVQMKDRPFLGKDPMSVITFLQYPRSAFDACGKHEKAAMWLFKQYFIGLIKAAVKSHVVLLNFVSTGLEKALRTCSKVVNFL